MFFSKNVKYLCKMQDKTLVELANELNMSKQNLNRLLNVNNPTAETLITFSDLFKIKIDDLIRKDLTNL